jgi:hypothetical protein
VIGYVFRLLLVLFLLRLIFRFIAGLVAGLQGGARRGQVPRSAAPPTGVALVRDRVCGTFVPRDGALTATINGQQEHFCSEACRRKALGS